MRRGEPGVSRNADRPHAVLIRRASGEVEDYGAAGPTGFAMTCATPRASGPAAGCVRLTVTAGPPGAGRTVAPGGTGGEIDGGNVGRRT
ncbi:hypothetical protein SAMN05444365_102673 [Micromonospora pattaloongensis]|uniref:Uncharacterized protein n=1 Tax=Micromonospora pattaloongensis TaxID=405436 RepID=A0A1H3KYD3_9ACTN|nr:hypothetical protein SAMN05444365_102673 [Micromonospora pattaloongensis]